MKNLLCLDFDGVICDSINECLLVSYNCFFELNGQRFRQVEEIIKIPANIREMFYRKRYLVRPAKDYWLLMKLIIEDNSLIDEENFSRNLIGKDDYLNEFEKLFFNYRENMIKERLELWLSLNPIYPEFYDYYRVNSTKEFYIVTNKNRSAVETILKHNNIEIDQANIISKEILKSKESALKKIAELNKLDNNQLIFIDDSPATIRELNSLFPNSYLANWGYYKNNSGCIKSINSLLEIAI